ncbi:MAG: 4-phosphoerythronate dehydrogenase PdxB [Chlorobi bacterium]|nr:4-phosphoerythronate dehydrogenase PdxB [Chlorobiota bacterium]
MKFIIDDKIPFIQGVLEKFGEVRYLSGKEIKREDVKDADALITRTRTKCNEELLSDSKVRIIASATIGYDHIDTKWCDTNGIKWTNAPGCNSGSVMQYIASVFSLLITEKGFDLKGKKIGIVGVGNVGSKVSIVAKAFGMDVFEIDPPRQEAEPEKRFYSLNDIASELDIITFHTPLTKEGKHKTFHLFNEELLQKLKQDVIIINSSRGEVVDNILLKNALRENRIALAILDVWENEPDIDLELLDKVWIGTPHIAGYSQDGKANGTMMSIRAVSRETGLGIDNWEPAGIPEPEQKIITIDPKITDNNHALANTILHTYNVRNDDKALREAPEKFEYLRGSYPVRREFFAYRVMLKTVNETLKQKLEGLGFEVRYKK